ncbi:acylphosphatase [Roseivirga thermotolerans]|jgi:acylphosphatase|uniref:acylphosphatase n=2 Tax=Roseivirgaceae TaxID=2762306 RepID=A0ABQ3I5U8_9BACT|nr:acylphosphatase [Roseivirga thermotolerans]|tara:strand:- start:31082 stop:31357 length:276 start_codon:yes stop_codon:yes gene_type:complete
MEMAISITVKGKVQGVFYRASCQKKAQALGVTGWCRNLPNGDVEIHAEGSDQALNQFVDWCKNGPEQARVEATFTHKVEAEGFSTFEIRRA